MKVILAAAAKANAVAEQPAIPLCPGSLFWSAQSECTKPSEGDVFEPVESG